MKLINKPTKRRVIWIKSLAGNEGKSWIQAYFQSYFGTKITNSPAAASDAPPDYVPVKEPSPEPVLPTVTVKHEHD